VNSANFLFPAVEVGEHFYWNIAGFTVHGQVLSNWAAAGEIILEHISVFWDFGAENRNVLQNYFACGGPVAQYLSMYSKPGNVPIKMFSYFNSREQKICTIHVEL
jgi:hypothetical protein